MNKTVVFILSTNFAGSHFLSLLLGSHSRSQHVGELFQLVRPPRKIQDSRQVYLTAGTVLEGIGSQNICDIYEIIFSRLDPRIAVLVDASKIIRGWAERFLDDQRYHKKYIHLIRDPRALVRKWGQTRSKMKEWKVRWKLLRSVGRVPFGAGFSAPSNVWMYRWLLQNRAITDFIQRHRLDANLVTYRDLARDTATEVRRLTEWVGLPFEAGQLEYWNREHIGTQKRSYDWVKEQKTRYFDLRWKSELPAEVLYRAETDPALNRYLTELGLRFCEEGLTRTAENPYVARAYSA